jgi:hypothetical protein
LHFLEVNGNFYLMADKICKMCGSPLPEIRLGARLTPLKALIFDRIHRAGPDGILWQEISSDYSFFGRGGRRTLKAHVHQINKAILGSGFFIYGRGGTYRLMRAGCRKIRTKAGRGLATP